MNLDPRLTQFLEEEATTYRIISINGYKWDKPGMTADYQG